MLSDCCYVINGISLFDTYSGKLATTIHYISNIFCCRSHLAFYIIHTVIMILALLIAARKANPLAYDDGIDKFRGICEAFLGLFFVYDVYAMVHQVIR